MRLKKTEHAKALDAFKLLDEYCRNHATDCKECVFNHEDSKATYGCGLVTGLSDPDEFSVILDRATKRAGELGICQ